MDRPSSRNSASGARPPSRDRALGSDFGAGMASRPLSSAMRASAPSSRPSTRGSAGAGTRPPTGRQSQSRGGAVGGLFSREEEYQRLNSQLEAQTAKLITQAEQVLRHKEEILSSFERAHEQAATTFEPSDDDYDHDHGQSTGQTDQHESDTLTHPHSHGDAYSPAAASTLPPRTASARPQSRGSEQVASGLPPRTASSRPPTKGGSSRPHSRQGAPVKGEEEDAVMAAVLAGEISDEAAVRLLKAKLKVMLEERAATVAELRSRDEVIGDLENRLKVATTEGTRHDGIVRTLQQQADKAKRALEEALSSLEAERTAAAAMKKELDATRKAQRADSASHGGIEIRLNRALEENQRLKDQLQQAQQHSREADEQLRDRVTRAEAEARTLAKHKADLLAAFQKQSQLVDVLRRQRLHIEAAKALGFCEEEFMKALDWSG
eukprot:m.239097 g.239097  ORF g.239097 m.239097 type:complete len:437 (+) comp22316_c0_seq1:67-1377(+)